MKRILLACAALFLQCWMPARAQLSVEDCLSDFGYGVGMVEKAYSGFDFKVTDSTRAAYVSFRDSVRTALAAGEMPFEDAFGRYLAWFRDYHLHDVCGAQDKYMPGPVDYAARMEYKPADTFCKVDDDTFLIRYTSCVWSASRVRWVKKAVRAFKKSGCRQLILDLRGNGGGADGTSDPFIELLYDHDGYYDGVVIRNTPVNIGFFRKAMKGDKYWQKHLDACEQSDEAYPTLFEPHLVHYDKVSRFPLKAALIIDNHTASTAETLVLMLRRVSDRVTVFGKDPTMGCRDYANAGLVVLPKTDCRFRLPLTCTLGLPATGIDATGIVPEVVIDCDDPQSLTDKVDEWTRWVASWLKAH